MRRNGFTFIQGLLLVVGTLILGLMLFPLFGRGRVQYARSPCQTHLKQIGMGFKQYLQDYNERYPSLETVEGWRYALWPYTKDNTIFQCP